MREAIAGCVALALLSIASGIALINCPFLVSDGHPACCHGKSTPRKCPLSSSFETCPYVPLDSKFEPADAAVDMPPPVLAAHVLVSPPIQLESEPVAWTPSLTDLHIRIRVLLI